MTASTLTHLPLAAGGAIAAGVGRAGLWAVARYMRAPLANTGLLALATFTAMAGSNALYNQHMPHPAPLFADPPAVPEPITTVAEPEIVVPEPQPSLERAAEPLVEPQALPAMQAPQPVTGETTGSLNPVVPDHPVGNEQVFAVQKKLLDLELFQGDVDGYYGPKTAQAIRAFEERNGMTPMGALTPEIVEAILKADAGAGVPTATTAASVQPAAAPQTVAAQTTNQPDILIGPVEREVTIESIVASATQTIDSIVASLDEGRTTPAAPAVKPVPQMPVQAVRGTPAARQEMPPLVTETPQAAATQTAAAQQPQLPARVAAVADHAGAEAPTSNTELVRQVQRGLASLGFLHGAITGEANAETARAIRNFEVYHNYKVTGRVTPELVDMLIAAGASV